jgi:hypothetical protein
MVKILAPFLFLSALSGTCLSHPVKRDVDQALEAYAKIGTCGDQLNIDLPRTSQDTIQASFEVSLQYILLSVAALMSL